ncbi:MAG: hypothetical protein K2P51_07035 [Rhabdochlamydiaceae bacterium]|nr:hypothetical protein [Rhabdochlamydiaceae bacterium]
MTERVGKWTERGWVIQPLIEWIIPTFKRWGLSFVRSTSITACVEAHQRYELFQRF